MKIIEAEACPDHIHLFVEIPPKYSVSGFMGYLKGKSAAIMYEQFGELRYKYRNREFCCRGYYVDTVGKNEKRIAEYIQNQLKEDKMGEQLVIPSAGSFTGRRQQPLAAGGSCLRVYVLRAEHRAMPAYEAPWFYRGALFYLCCLIKMFISLLIGFYSDPSSKDPSY